MAPPLTGARTLSRDYKDVRRHKHVAVGHTSFNGWVGLGVGLSLGLLVALGVHLHYTRQAQVNAGVPRLPSASARIVAAAHRRSRTAAVAADIAEAGLLGAAPTVARNLWGPVAVCEFLAAAVVWPSSPSS